MNYGHDIEILIGNKAWHYYGETGTWSMVPLGFMKNDVFLSNLVSPTASLLQRFPSKFSDKIPVRIENHNPGVGHHNLSLHSKLLFLISPELEKEITCELTQTLITSFNSNFSPIFLLIFLEKTSENH